MDAKVSRVFTLDITQFFPRPLGEVFSFFADAMNLQRITPPWLHFRVLTPPPIAMHAGALIDYRIRLRGIPLRWRTQITRWDPPYCFVDEQLRGPYRLWRHRHEFIERDGGTLVTDHVDYQVLGGRLINRFLVRPDLDRIFAYRQAALTECMSAANHV